MEDKMMATDQAKEMEIGMANSTIEILAIFSIQENNQMFTCEDLSKVNSKD